MRSFLLITIAALTFGCQTRQAKEEFIHVIKAADLVKVVEDGDFDSFLRILRMTEFQIKDSTLWASGRAIYNCEDSSGRNNITAITKNKIVSNLNLYTEDKRLVDKIEGDLRDQGFYHDNDPFDGKLIKKGSLIEIRGFVEEGGLKIRYQLLINKRDNTAQPNR